MYIDQSITRTYSIVFNCIFNWLFVYSAIPIDTTLQFNVILTAGNWIIRINSIFQSFSKEIVKLDECHDYELYYKETQMHCVVIYQLFTKYLWLPLIRTYSYTNNCNVLTEINCKYSNIDLVSHGINIGHANSCNMYKGWVVVKQCKKFWDAVHYTFRSNCVSVEWMLLLLMLLIDCDTSCGVDNNRDFCLLVLSARDDRWLCLQLCRTTMCKWFET